MKVLLVLVDGMRPDALNAQKTAQKILARSCYATEAKTVMPSVTLPCHMSLFHSVEPSRHGTTTNVYMPQVRPVKGLCELLCEHKKKSAFFYNWSELRDLARPGSLSVAQFFKGKTFGYDVANDRVTDAAIESLRENTMDFTFVYLGFTDAAGHNHGWMSKEYMAAIDNSWNNIERLIEALPEGEDYAVIITADHGGHDRCHGTEMPEDMTIPLILMGAPFPSGSALSEASILDIAPTIAHLLGVEKDEEWEGKSLV